MCVTVVYLGQGQAALSTIGWMKAPIVIPLNFSCPHLESIHIILCLCVIFPVFALVAVPSFLKGSPIQTLILSNTAC